MAQFDWNIKRFFCVIFRIFRLQNEWQKKCLSNFSTTFQYKENENYIENTLSSACHFILVSVIHSKLVYDKLYKEMINSQILNSITTISSEIKAEVNSSSPIVHLFVAYFWFDK